MPNIWSYLYSLIAQKALDVNFKGVGTLTLIAGRRSLN